MNQTLPSTGKPRSIKQITATKPFAQNSQRAMANPMGHPARNLGNYAHPPKGRHAETKAAKPRENLHSTQTSVAGVDMGSSDVKSEAIGPDLGPLMGKPAPFTAKANKKKQMKGKPSGTPFFGSY